MASELECVDFLGASVARKIGEPSGAISIFEPVVNMVPVVSNIDEADYLASPEFDAASIARNATMLSISGGAIYRALVRRCHRIDATE